MRKIIVFMHTTLDGFTAGPNGEMDWIYIDADMFDFVGEMTGNADAALYGRKTYEMMDGYWPTAGQQPNAGKHDIEHSNWYNKVEKIVLSHTMKSSKPNVRIISDNLSENIGKLKHENGKDILIFGSPTATHALFNLGLIDEMWLLVNPVVIGKGIPMFDGASERQQLKLAGTKQFGEVLAMHYTKA